MSNMMDAPAQTDIMAHVEPSGDIQKYATKMEK